MCPPLTVWRGVRLWGEVLLVTDRKLFSPLSRLQNFKGCLWPEPGSMPRSALIQSQFSALSKYGTAEWCKRCAEVATAVGLWSGGADGLNLGRFPSGLLTTLRKAEEEERS
ncbi:hypothetical protein AOLI_G00105370 [Acnodon oligacanthus]